MISLLHKYHTQVTYITLDIFVDIEFDESFDVETPANLEDEISLEHGNLEQICSSDSAVIKKDSNPQEYLSPKEYPSPKKYPSPKEYPSPIEDPSLKEDLSPKEEPSPIEDPSPKEDPSLKEDPSQKENHSQKEDSNLNEDHNPKEDQPNHTNRWSLQEHPNKKTTVRNSPSLGSIPKHKRASKCSKDELSDLPETWDEECQKHLVDFAER